MAGYIYLDRSICDHWIYSRNEYFSAFIKMLFEVNFQDASPVPIKGRFIECKRGQSINSLATWVGVLGDGWTIQRVRTFFKLLESDGIINMENLSVTTRLTICKYETYQNKQHGTNMESNTQATRRQHASNNKRSNVSNDNEGNEKKTSLVDFACNLVDDPERMNLIREWFKYKSEIKKPMKSELGVKRMVSEWSKYTNKQISDVMNHSMSNNYQGMIWDKLTQPQPASSTVSEKSDKELFKKYPGLNL